MANHKPHHEADIVDLRDIIDDKDNDMETYTIWAQAIERDGGRIEEMAKDEPLMIHQDYFTVYAQELAEGNGFTTDALPWPSYCIDWEQAAEELLEDYCYLHVQGVVYYYRYEKILRNR